MSKTKVTGYEAGADYEVHLAKAVTVGRRTLSPMHSYVLKGAVLDDLPEGSIKEARKVD